MPPSVPCPDGCRHLFRDRFDATDAGVRPALPPPRRMPPSVPSPDGCRHPSEWMPASVCLPNNSPPIVPPIVPNCPQLSHSPNCPPIVPQLSPNCPPIVPLPPNCPPNSPIRPPTG